MLPLDILQKIAVDGAYFVMVRTCKAIAIGFPMSQDALMKHYIVQRYGLDGDDHCNVIGWRLPNGRLHAPSLNTPSLTIYNTFVNEYYWYYNGMSHRDNDLPALDSDSGKKAWVVHGIHKRPNPNDPHAITKDGTYIWLFNKTLHRDDDLPAVIKPDGTKYWFRYGEKHRDYGPAVTYSNGHTEYWHMGDYSKPLVINH